MDTFNAAITTVAYGGKVNVNTKITAAADNVFTFYSTLTYRQRDVLFDNIIWDLGKSQY